MIHDAGIEVVLVVTQPESRRSRGGDDTHTPVGTLALELGLPVITSLNDRALSAIISVASPTPSDPTITLLGVVVAYGVFFDQQLLDRLLMINLHFSLLPRWRGAAPVERAILAGDTETGVCLMQVVEEVDAGAVYDRSTIQINDDDTAGSIHSRLTRIGADMLTNALLNGLPKPVEQVGDWIYAEKITPDDLRIDWNQPAELIQRIVRVGGAWTTFRNKRLKILKSHFHNTDASLPPGTITINDSQVHAATPQGTIELIEVQSEGKAAIPAEDWSNGMRIQPNERLGE